MAGDSGAGYLNPGYLTPPRPHSGLESGLAAWERHCTAFYRRWDLDVTGFVIDGFASGLSLEGRDAYARVSEELARLAGTEVRVLDLPALLWLVREYETHRGD